MSTYSDSFSGSGPLGTTEVGGAQWVIFKWWGNSVSWSRSGGRAVPSDLTTPSIAAINAGTGDCDVSVNVSPGGGDSLYFRVKDFENWWRLTVVEGVKQGDEAWESGVGTSEYLWQQQYRHPDPTEGSYPLITYEYLWSSSNGSPPAFPASIWFAHAHDTDGNGVDDYSHSGYYYAYGNASVVDGKVGSPIDNTWSVYYVRLEKSVDGNVEEVDFWVQGANHLRVVLQRSLINVYINNTNKGQYTDSTHERATFHGIGFNWYSGATSTGLDNFAIDTFFTDPTAPTVIGPKGGAVINRDIPQQFTWTFNDPDPGDLQAKAELRWRLVGSGTWTNSVTVSSPNPYYVFPAGTFTEGANYEWAVRTTDQTNRTGPWSTGVFFTAENQPNGPTITSPTNGGTVQESHVATWSASSQQSYQLRILDSGGGTYFDTGEVVSTTARSHSLAFTETGLSLTIQVRVKVDGLWSEYGAVTVTTQFTPPPAPYFNVLATRELAALLIEISNPAPGGTQPSPTHNEIWIDDGAGFSRKVKTWPTNTNWVYWTPVSGRDYISSVRVVAVGTNGAKAFGNPPKYVELATAVCTDLGQTVVVFKGKGAAIGLVTAGPDKAWRLGVPLNRAIGTEQALSMGVAKPNTRPVGQVTGTHTAQVIAPCRTDPFNPGWGCY